MFIFNLQILQQIKNKKQNSLELLIKRLIVEETIKSNQIVQKRIAKKVNKNEKERIQITTLTTNKIIKDLVITPKIQEIKD